MMMPIMSLREPPRLPVDLYRPIIQLLSNTHDLATLCTVSRTFRSEAERILYRDIKLPCSYTSMVSWSSTISGNPRLASIVNALAISFMAPFTYFQKYTFQQSICKALHSVVNLNELYIINSPTSCGFRYIEPWIFEGCAFSLRTYHNEIDISLSPSLTFLSQQRNIRCWRSRLSEMRCDEALRDESLPQLLCANVDTRILKLLPPRPIKHLRLEGILMDRNVILEFVNSLGTLQATLTHLSITTILATWMSATDIVPIGDVTRLIGEYAPKLQFLCISGSIVLQLQSDKNVQALLDSMSSYCAIETIVIAIKNDIRQKLRHFSQRLHSQQACRDFAKLFMTFSPSLWRVSFPVEGGWAKGCPCFIRSATGEVELEGFDVINEDSWADEMITPRLIHW